MKPYTDPFEIVVIDDGRGDFQELTARPATLDGAGVARGAAVATARLSGFDRDDRPLLASLPELPEEIVVARTTIPLMRNQVGSSVVVLFDRGDVWQPIIVGVLLESSTVSTEPARQEISGEAGIDVSVQADDHRLVLSAEREIILRCGDASITLTKAGKVLIKGKYILSRSAGYNRLKGAAVDIN